MRHLDLFSGIGGFALAAQNVWAQDHEIVSFCEIDSYCQKVLKKHWPDVPCHNDIKTLIGDNLGAIDLLTGGFPCQPFSVAGKQGGSADDRYLWPEMFRIIQKSKSTWIIGENVAGLDGLGLDKSISDLESIGYEVAPPLEIPACAVDSDQPRNRIWIIAHSKSIGERRGTAHSREKKELMAKDSQKWTESRRRLERYYLDPIRHQTPLAEDLRGNYGLSDWVDRLKGLGNAIRPQVVIPIMQAIKQIEENIHNNNYIPLPCHYE